MKRGTEDLCGAILSLLFAVVAACMPLLYILLVSVIDHATTTPIAISCFLLGAVFALASVSIATAIAERHE